MFCRYCGRQLDEGVESCDNCEQSTGDEQATQVLSTTKSDKNLKWYRKLNWYLSLPMIFIMTIIFFPISIGLFIWRFIITKGTKKYKSTIIYMWGTVAVLVGFVAWCISLHNAEQKQLQEINVAIESGQYESAYTLIKQAEHGGVMDASVRDAYVKYYKAQGLYDEAANVLQKYYKNDKPEDSQNAVIISRLEGITGSLSDEKKAEVYTFIEDAKHQRQLVVEAKQREQNGKEVAQKEVQAQPEKSKEAVAEEKAEIKVSPTPIPTSTQAPTIKAATQPNADATIQVKGDVIAVTKAESLFEEYFVRSIEQTKILYRGPVSENRPHGNGVLIDSENIPLRLFVGNFKNGVMEGRFTVYDDYIQPIEGSLGVSEVNTLALTGDVNAIFIKVYEGDMKNSKYHGKGAEYMPYDIKSDVALSKRVAPLYKFTHQLESSQDGMAITFDFLQLPIEDSKQARQIGDFKNGKMDGNIAVYVGDKTLYEGGYKYGAANGKGRKYNNDGILLYDGEFLDGDYHGKGTLYNTDGSVRATGNWKKGQLH